MMGSKRLKDLLQGFITNLQPVEMGFDLGSLGSIVVSNLLVMAMLGKLNLQIHIKEIKGESLKSFSEVKGVSFIWPFSKYGQLTPIDAQEPCISSNGIIPPLNPSLLRMWTWLQIPDTLNMWDGGSMYQHRCVEGKMRLGHLWENYLPSFDKINGIVVR